MTDPVRRALLYHFCRMQTPGVVLPPAAFDRHLDRTFGHYRRKNPGVTFPEEPLPFARHADLGRHSGSRRNVPQQAEHSTIASAL